MRRARLLAVLFGASAMLAATAAPAQQAPRPQQGQRPGAQQQAGPSFTIRNEGSRTLREFYASSPSDADWGPDRLGADVVSAGQTFRIQLPRGAGCMQDLRAVYDDNSAVERRGVDICRERLQAFRNVEPDAEVTVVNGHPRVLFQLYFRPDGQADWGPDRLGSSTVEAGGRETIRFTAGGNCVFDVRIVFDNDAAEERRAVNLCEQQVVAFTPGWTTADEVPSELDAPRAGRPGPGRPPGPPALSGGITIRNRGSVPIVRLFVDPPGAQSAGPDRLGDSVIGPGGSFALAPPQGLCVGDLVATFRDGTRARRERVALCDGAEVSLP